MHPISHPTYVQKLNDRQREAVLITDGPLIVLAGAGSGKTRMLTSRISYLIEQHRIPAYQILAVTFTNKAAAEMRERVEKTLREAATSVLGIPEIGTFHSVCIRLIRREMDRTPFTKPFVIYDDSDQLSLIKTVFEKLNLDEKTISPKSIQGAINRAKCDAIDPENLEVPQHDFFKKQLKRVYEQYQKDLFANNALDFGEIICMAYRILRDHPDVREKYQKRYRYVHVDEYQDTNRAQYLFLSMLVDARQGGHLNICVVGDEDQSIYKWRGADIRNILDFETDFPGAQIVKLEQNYRSTKTIITAASQVIRNNTSRKDKTLWTENEQGLPIVRAHLPDERAEAEMAISEIKRLAGNDNRAFSDFAIFYRTNAQSRQFEDVLRREKIPYQIVGGLRFYDRKEIKDILSYFKAIMNPSDSVSLRRIINVPARGIGKTTVEKIDAFHAELGGDYWQSLNRAASDPDLLSASTRKKIGQFVEMMQRFMNEQPKILLSELYHLILDETGYVGDLKKENTEESLGRIENLEEFDSLLQEFEEDQIGDDEAKKREMIPQLLPLFIEQSSLASDVDNLDSYASSVKLMTLHSSKGLEFPVVFMVGMEEGLFPSIKPWEETPEEDIEEERRLCYVGMTRARDLLYMASVNIRRIWGNATYQEPSRFFVEIPDHLMEVRDFSYGRAADSFRLGSSRKFMNARVPVQTSQVHSTGSISPFASIEGELIGQRLDHPDYGLGTVLATEGSGDHQKITVEFQGRERRKFLMKYVAEFLVSNSI